MGEKFDPSRVDAIAAKVKAGVSETATYATSVLTSIFQSVIARKPRKKDGLQQLIEEIVGANRDITEKQLRRELETREDCGVIVTITDEVIEFVTAQAKEDDADQPIETAPISGLKDRLSRAKEFLKNSR